ncbi:glycine cleavage system aminomethyltransferase GcvT [Sulfuracidifex tepidarius]|uniref:aminomethyltransferase n=1 Tax=Sulfuracidifex tepidarius TaxID=1294262 RepID=A0A510E219_9CREN|nr:glycine cleavage system aminomethyltransferase GcvT [Sulfuracidifex tepidarius]BBG26545.1 putative aminomethyltransferase [Sulfuracidifex tepidarius]
MFVSPLFEVEEKSGANFGEFAGWNMPMTYSSYQEEHLAVRNSVAVFDLSHMGRLRVKGRAEELEELIAKELNGSTGQMIGPTAFLNDRGGFIDDVMTYKISDSDFLLVTNATNREKVIKWIKSNSSLDVEDLTFSLAMIAIQGKKVKEIFNVDEIPHMTFKLNVSYMGMKVFLLSRSGWTGEDGIEVWAEPEIAGVIFTKLAQNGVKPAGLVTRDSIRQEMGYLLYGEDIDESVTPVEARYWVFSLSKGFVGKDAIVEQLRNGVSKIRFGFKMKKGMRVIPRRGMEVTSLGSKVGYVTSSTFSPFLNRVIGMGYISPQHFFLGYSTTVEIRGKTYEIKMDDFPFI